MFFLFIYLLYYLRARSQAPACEGHYFSFRIYYVYNVGLDRLKSVDDRLWPKPAATGCQTGLDRKEPVSCGPVRFYLVLQCE